MNQFPGKFYWGIDEFDILANAVNDMRRSLNDSYSHLKGEIFEKNRKRRL